MNINLYTNTIVNKRHKIDRRVNYRLRKTP